MNSTLRSVIKGPRWARISTALRNAAFEAGLEIKIDVEKHIIQETVRFEVFGPHENIVDFRAALIKKVEEMNK